MTAADKLRGLLATRPAMPNTEELVRWWRETVKLIPELLGQNDALREQYKEVSAMHWERREELAKERDELRAELDRMKKSRDNLDQAAPVMLTAMAYVASEAEAQDVCEMVAFYESHCEDHLEVWLDAERRRVEQKSAKETEAHG